MSAGDWPRLGSSREALQSAFREGGRKPVGPSNNGPHCEQGSRQVRHEGKVHVSARGRDEQVCCLQVGEQAAGALHVSVQVALTQHVLVQPTQHQLVVSEIAQHAEQLLPLFLLLPSGRALQAVSPKLRRRASKV